MRTSEVFVLGTITGAVVVWLWGGKIREYAGEKTRGVRARTAAGLQTVEEKTGQVLEHVSDALRAGQNAIRPASTTGGGA
jgi:hypothetical protein